MLYEDIGQSEEGNLNVFFVVRTFLLELYHRDFHSGSYRSFRLLLRGVESVTTTTPEEMHNRW